MDRPSPGWPRALWRRLRPGPRLVVPETFNRNSARVSALMPAEESGAWLLERLRQRLGLESLARTRLLDFGCGVRFSQAILNRRLAIGAYAGVDCYAAMIDFLRANVRDRRFTYVFLDAHHPLYNPQGRPLGPETALPLPAAAYDAISLFSVITHQSPADAAAILALLRRHVAPRGQLFLTCFLDPAIADFEDRSPERNGGFCFYNPDFLARLVEGSGWRVSRRDPGEGPLIGDSLVCAPV